MRRARRITALSLSLLALSASAALAAIVVTTDPANAPSGTHLQSGAIGCVVGSDNLTVTCSGYELGGVGNINATVNLTANYSATIDCRNKGGNVVESHTEFFNPVDTEPAVARKNGRMVVGGLQVSLPDLTGRHCPNPNWTAEFRPGTPTLNSFTYTLVFDGFSGAYITITGP